MAITSITPEQLDAVQVSYRELVKSASAARSCIMREHLHNQLGALRAFLHTAESVVAEEMQAEKKAARKASRAK